MDAFANRDDAARQLARRLREARLPAPIVVLALPRGGVPIGAEVARVLDAPLDVLLVRKIGAPWQPELGVGALVDADPPELVVDEAMCRRLGIERTELEGAVAAARIELERRRACYLGGKAPLPLQGATVVVVDDGMATGTTVRAALRALRRRRPARLVLAVPVAPRETLARLRPEVDALICLATPEPFEAVGMHYRDFHQVDDAEVLAALASAARPAD